MLINRALYKESSYEISLKLDEKCCRGISYSSQIVFFQLLHYTCFSGAICPLQVPGFNLFCCRLSSYKLVTFITLFGLCEDVFKQNSSMGVM